MDKIVFVVDSNCADPAREDEFNEWYNNTHVPDLLETPGVVRGTRYERLDPAEGQAKYLTIYEIETDDFPALVKAATENMEKKKAEGRDSDLLQITAQGSFKQIFSHSK